MELNWSLVLDVTMIFMLAAAVGYSYVLNQNLNKLRAEKAEFEQTIRQLSLSIRQAEAGIQDIKLAAQDIASRLEAQVAVGRGLSQELQFMIESGDSLANRLTGAASTGVSRSQAYQDEVNKTSSQSQTTGAFAVSASSPRLMVPPDLKPRSQAETRLLEELKRIESERIQRAGGEE